MQTAKDIMIHSIRMEAEKISLQWILQTQSIDIQPLCRSKMRRMAAKMLAFTHRDPNHICLLAIMNNHTFQC